MTAAIRTDLDSVAREQADAELARIVRCPACLHVSLLREAGEGRGGGATLERLPASDPARGFRCTACPGRYLEGEDGILDLVAADGPTAEPATTTALENDRVRKRYDREALLYDLAFRIAAPLVFRGSLDRMRELARRVGATRIALDLPAGTGFFLPPPADGTALVVASDLSRSMLRRAKARASREPGRLPRTRFVRADVFKLPFETGAFGGVSCLNGLHVFPDPLAAAKELSRVRSPGGLAVGCAVTLPPFGPRRAAARAFVWRNYMTTLFQEADLRAVLTGSGLALTEDAFREGHEIYWASRGSTERA